MDAKDLENAVRAYASEREGFNRSKVCFSEDWFTSGRWLKYLHDIEEAREAGKAKEVELLKGLAEWITDRHPLRRHIKPGQVTALLAAVLVSAAEIEAAGLGSIRLSLGAPLARDRLFQLARFDQQDPRLGRPIGTRTHPPSEGED